jgi:hypothetical protein
MKTAAKQMGYAKGGTRRMHRNGASTCLLMCRCHSAAHLAESDPPEKSIVQSGKSGHDSVFSFCKTTDLRAGSNQPKL